MNIDTNKVEDIVRLVGEYLVKHYGKSVPQKLKEGTHYDTVHDQIASDIYKDKLSKLYPNVQFYSEEEQVALNPSKAYWMIDPIEGTTNFSHGIPLFATQLAYIENQEIIFGCVYLPIIEECYKATKNNGAFCNNVQIHSNSLYSLSESVICLSKGTGIDNLTWWGNAANKIAKNVRTIRNLGGAGLEIAYVASGKLDLFINHGSHAYDYAAGSIIAKEAGASVVNFTGQDWQLTDSNIVIGNSKLVTETLPYVNF